MSLGRAFVVRSRAAWIDQFQSAFTALKAAGATDTMKLPEVNKLDHQQFCLAIEAMVALGQEVSPEIADLAELRPVDEVLQS